MEATTRERTSIENSHTSLVQNTNPQPVQTTSLRASVDKSQQNEKTGIYEACSELESQKMSQDGTHEEAEETTEPAEGEEAVEEEEPERLSQKIARVRASTWWFLGALVLAIPLIVFTIRFRNINMDGIHANGFIVWLEIIWTSGWISYLGIWMIGKAWYTITQKQYLDIDDWEDFFLNTASSQLVFVIALIAWGSSPVMCRFSDGACSDVYWLHIFRKVLLATIPVSSLFLAKGLLMEVLLTKQIVRLYNGKLEKKMRQFNAFTFIAEEVKEEQTRREKAKDRLNSLMEWAKQENIFMRKKRNDVDEKIKRYWQGLDKDEDFDHGDKTFPEEMKSNIALYVAMDRQLESTDLSQIVFTSDSISDMLEKRKKLNTRANLHDKPFTEKEIIEMIDKDGDQEISLGEWASVFVEVLMSLRDTSKSAVGIRRAAHGVNVVISCILLCIVAIIYAAFFTKNLSSYLTPIWTTVTGLSFALSGTVTEFIAACSFVFSKQPYDVGDRVIIDDKELIVDEICLLYSVFHRVKDGLSEQIAHSKISDVWIANMSRSRDLWLKAQVDLPSHIGKVSYERLGELREELNGYIRATTPCSRYLKADVRLPMHYNEEKPGRVVVEMQPREILVRREEVLARAREMVHDKLEKLLLAPPGVATALEEIHEGLIEDSVEARSSGAEVDEAASQLSRRPRRNERTE